MVRTISYIFQPGDPGQESSKLSGKDGIFKGESEQWDEITTFYLKPSGRWLDRINQIKCLIHFLQASHMECERWRSP